MSHCNFVRQRRIGYYLIFGIYYLFFFCQTLHEFELQGTIKSLSFVIHKPDKPEQNSQQLSRSRPESFRDGTGNGNIHPFNFIHSCSERSRQSRDKFFVL